MALARLTGSPDLKIPEPTRHPLPPVASSAQHLLVLQHLQLRSLQLAIFRVHGRIGPILQGLASPWQPHKVHLRVDFEYGVFLIHHAHMTNGLNDVSCTRFSFCPNHGSSFSDTTQGFTQVISSTDKKGTWNSFLST